jgi:hypothetical protein
MAGETSSRPTVADFEISTRATPGISASNKYIIACDIKLIKEQRYFSKAKL